MRPRLGQSIRFMDDGAAKASADRFVPVPKKEPETVLI
jgi:hypothetical protein